MFNQFHDIMGGCSIREAFDDARESYGEALHIGAKALNAAVQKLSWSIGTMKPHIAALSTEKDWHLWEQGDLGVPYVVFNPLSWELDALVQANKRLASVEDELGNALPIQSVRASRTNGSDKWDTLFPARVPAFGYRVFWMYRDRPAVHPWPRTGMLEAAEDRLENELVRIVLDRQTGYIKQLYDKRLNCDLFRADAAVPVVLDETDSDTWGHNRDRYRNEIGKFSGATLKLIENGPLRATIGVTSCYGTSSLRQYVSLRHDSSVVQVRVDLDWREKHRMLKLSFPAGVKEPHATWEIPYGHLSRPVDGKEVPGQSWVYVSGQAVSAAASSESAEGLLMSSPVIGVGIANDAKYGYDVLEHEIRLTVVRSPIYADHYGQRDEWVEYMDQGQQQFQYSIISHPGHWQESGIQRKADELNVPPITIWETYHEGELPQCYEGVRISSPQVSVTALKRAEDNNGWIARCHETLGKPTAVQIELPALQRVWQAVFGASEVKTFAIPDDADLPVGEVNFIEHIVRE
jgi:alpha-mannosidase